jgi:hypothetical protein
MREMALIPFTWPYPVWSSVHGDQSTYDDYRYHTGVVFVFDS